MELTDNERLKQKIALYKPSDETIALVQDTPILLLVGISGAGKDSIAKELFKLPAYHPIVSHTTRKPRVNDGVLERDGREYHFITLKQSERMLDGGAYIEAAVYGGNIYGTSAVEVGAAHNAHKIATTDLEVQGVAHYMAMSQNVKAVFIVPPSYDVWQERFSKRYGATLTPAEMRRRMKTALHELEHALQVPYFHFVVNDSLHDAVVEVDEIATGSETRQEAARARLAAAEICRRLQSAMM